MSNNPQDRPFLDLTVKEWLWPLATLLCMSMIGLAFPLGYLGLLIILVNRFKNDRYDFLITITIWFGGYAFIGHENYPFKTYDLALALSLLGAFVLKKTPIIRKTILAWVTYTIILLIFAYLSEEKMKIQILMLRIYLLFIYFTVPLLIFANQAFDIKLFFRRLMPFILIICIFYIIDCIVFSGNVLIPNSFTWASEIPSRFYHLVWEPFSFNLVRKYPPGLFWLALSIFPIIHLYRLKAWHWIIIALALFSCRTFTVISGLIIVYILFQRQFRKILLYVFLMIVSTAIIYFIDLSMGVNESGESTFRISSSINQLVDLGSVKDDEDFAQTGSGRMAQAIPKIELLFSYDREWIGLGFLHPEKTKNPKYIIFNEYYSDIEKAEEVSTGIEVELLQIFVTIGILGLIVFFCYFGYICWLIRNYKYRGFFLSVALCMLWFGIGGFGGLSQVHGLVLSGMCYGIVLLSGKSKKDISLSNIL